MCIRDSPTVEAYRVELEQQQTQDRLRASSLLSPQRQYENKQRYIDQHRDKIDKAKKRLESNAEQLAKIEAEVKDDRLKIEDWAKIMAQAEKERDELWKLTNPAPTPEVDAMEQDEQPEQQQQQAASRNDLLLQLREHLQTEVQAGDETKEALLQSINREMFLASEKSKLGAIPNESGASEGTSGFGPARAKQGERAQPYEAGSAGKNETEHVEG